MVSALALGDQEGYVVGRSVPESLGSRNALKTNTTTASGSFINVSLSSFSLLFSLSLSLFLFLFFSISLYLSFSLSLYLCLSLSTYVSSVTARTEFNRRKREASRKKGIRYRWCLTRFTWPVPHPWPRGVAEVERMAVSSSLPTWRAVLGRSGVEERHPSTRTRWRCSDCSRWSLACRASGRATVSGRAWIRMEWRICRRATRARCWTPPLAACPAGIRRQQRTQSRTIPRICLRPPSGSVTRCYSVSPRSRSAVSNARRLVSFIRRQLPTKTKEKNKSLWALGYAGYISSLADESTAFRHLSWARGGRLYLTD